MEDVTMEAIKKYQIDLSKLVQNQESQTFKLRDSLLIDHPNLSVLIADKKLVQTFPTRNWNLLFVDQTEQFAIFEADDSWYMAILDIHTGEWKEDLKGSRLHYSQDGESVIDNFNGRIHPFSE